MKKNYHLYLGKAGHLTVMSEFLTRGWNVAIPEVDVGDDIFVAYGTKSDFELYYDKLESYIYPALLGVNNRNDLNKKVDEIQFVDTHTGKILHAHKVIL